MASPKIYANSTAVYIDSGTGITHLPGCVYMAPSAVRATFVQAGVYGKGFCKVCFGLSNPWIGRRG